MTLPSALTAHFDLLPTTGWSALAAVVREGSDPWLAYLLALYQTTSTASTAVRVVAGTRCRVPLALRLPSWETTGSNDALEALLAAGLPVASPAAPPVSGMAA